jgi:hypothetical protein
MWTLIVIQLFYPSEGFYDVDAQMYGSYDNMIDCFVDREYVIEAMGGVNGFPPINVQAVCIRTDDGD